MKQKFCKWITCALGVCFFSSVTGAGLAEEKDDRPNILFILLDNVGKDWFRSYGSQEDQTPTMDELARTGVKFRNFYVTPVCSTTRVTLLTGRYPFRTGWHTHHDPAIYGGGYFDWKREKSIARVLKDAGYDTCISGKWQINDLFDPVQKDAIKLHGFDDYCLFPEGKKGHPAHKKRYWDPYVIQNGKRLETKGKYGPDIFTDYLIDYMAKPRKKPFFAYYSMILTHIPVGETPDNKGMDLSPREQFADMISYADQSIGRLTEALDRLGLRENTIIFITTDNGTDNGAFHGYENMGGKFQGREATVGSTMRPDASGYYPMKEWGINTPFIVNSPALIPGGWESDDLIDASDVLPTLADLARADLPQGVTYDGRSFAAQLYGEESDGAWRPWCFTQYHNKRVIRGQRFKLYSDGPFYDLSSDPLELRDLSKVEGGYQDEEVRAGYKQLKDALDSMPENAKLPWKFRSISARAFEASEGK
ncbi:MAG: sulfatase-like hydrolase/transferase [Verrucomicrobiales bacterium]|nr:sulfatase-like hydrolase/transferase [Verrucomicrobiales bacterium]